MMAERVQLKVCEGCGVLWVKPQVLRGVYCVRCDWKLKAFPRLEDMRRPGPKCIGPKKFELKKFGAKRQLTLPTVHAVAVVGGAR